MGSCTTKGKNADVVDKAHSILSKEGYLVKEVRDGKLGERPIPNKVAIVLKDQMFAYKIRYFASALDSQGLSAQVGVLCELKHPNFVRVYSCFTRSNLFFFKMDYYPTTLRQILFKVSQPSQDNTRQKSESEKSQTGNMRNAENTALERQSDVGFMQQGYSKILSKEKRMRYARELLQGVLIVHNAGHTHRELKSQNVMVSTNDNLVIAEFGLEFDSDVKKKREEKSTTSDKWYLAPEINQKQDSIYYQQTKQTDIYAVGLLIAEIFGWKYASVQTDTSKLEEIADKLKNSDKLGECLQEVDNDVKNIILPMLHPNPDKRGELDLYLKYFQEEKHEKSSK